MSIIIGITTSTSISSPASHPAICPMLSVMRLWHILYRSAVKLVNLRWCRAAVFASHLATRPVHIGGHYRSPAVPCWREMVSHFGDLYDPMVVTVRGKRLLSTLP